MKFHHISDGKNITKNNRQKITARGKSLSRKHVSLAPFAVLAVFVVATITSPVFLGNNFARADSYDDQISSLNSQNDSLKSQVSQLALQAGSIQAAITALQNQQAQIQTQIDASNAKIADLNAKIATDDQQIKDQSQALVTTLQNIYYDSQSNSTLNILMNSNSISDYVDAQARQDGIQSNLQKSIDNINKLKKQLADQKAQVQAILNSQVSQKQTLAASQAEQQSLENANAAQQAEFNSKVAANNISIANLQTQQKQAFAKSKAQYGGSGDYPFGSPAIGWNGYNNCDSKMFSFGSQTCAGQCVSYVQWEQYVHYGKTNTYGDAQNWPVYGHTPEENSVAIWSGGKYGHVAWVDSVNSDGTINISQYNAGLDGRFSTEQSVPSSYGSSPDFLGSNFHLLGYYYPSW